MSVRKLEYCESSQTLRLLPNNYLLAQKQNRSWICAPDAAIPDELAQATFKAIFACHDIKWGEPELLLKHLNSVLDVNQVYFEFLGAKAARANKDESDCPCGFGTDEVGMWLKGYRLHLESVKSNPYHSFKALGRGPMGDFGVEVCEMNGDMLVIAEDGIEGGYPIHITKQQAINFFCLKEA